MNDSNNNRNLKGYKEFPICRYVSSPVMFYGLPLHLAMIFCACFAVSMITALIMISKEMNFILIIVIAGGFGFTSCSGVYWFYRKYGLKGFKQSQRDKTLPNKYECNTTIQSLLKSKIKNNG